MEINVQEDKTLNKRLYKQSLSGTISGTCTVTFTNIEPGLYLSNVTIVPDSSVCDCIWGPNLRCGINGWCMCNYGGGVGARSFPHIINVDSTTNVSIKVDGTTRYGGVYCNCLVVDDKSVVFLKQL